MLVSGIMFSGLHLSNPGATWIWLLRLFCQGVLLAYAVFRTGSLGWSVGYHTGWNWVSAPLLGAVGSGYMDEGHIFDFHPHGSIWITGGSVGPEGSILAFLAVSTAFGILLLTTTSRHVVSQRKPISIVSSKSPVASPSSISTPPAIEIRSLIPGDDATAFRTLNEEWITRYFTLEAKDHDTLNDPVNSILLKDGHIFMAYAGAEAVGCVALIPMKGGVYELSKMAVSPHLRGRGIGRRLLQHAIAQAKHLGAKSLFLGSNTRLKNAVHLYESVGFRHVKPERLPPMPYSRADVFMEMSLE